jgi:FdhE protein
MSRSSEKWEKKIRRAQELAAAHPFAAQALTFYGHVAGFQRDLYLRLVESCPRGALRGAPDLSGLLPAFPSFLAFLGVVAPRPVAEAAAQLAAAGEKGWREGLEDFWRSPEETSLRACEALIAWTFLQPYAEALADVTEKPEARGTPNVCPLCSSRPLVGVLRPQGDGGKRSLICSLCAHEWEYRRIVCPACEEENVDRLPVYTAEELPHVRVEACESCHHYIKTIDLTKDGRAVPVVDELAAISLSLWAAENGYSKVTGNWVGL